MIAVRHQAEKDKATKAVQVEIDEELAEEQRRLADHAEGRLEAQRQALQDKIKAAKTSKLRQPLMD